MSANTVWDVDQYKTEHESEEHWQLRRSFMITHKDKFSEERLVCLAQVFANVEFLGCRYPAETMELVAELSQGVADTYREKQKTKLQRTFVKASDAAGAKVKGLKRPAADAAGPSDSPPKIHKCTDGQTQQNFSFGKDSAVTNTTCSKIEDKKQFDSKTIDLHPGLPLVLETFVSSKECLTLKDKELIQCNDSINNDEAIENCISEEKHVEDSDSKKLCKKITTRVIVKASQKRKIKRDVLCGSAKLDIIKAGRFGRLVLVQMEKETNPAPILERSTAACCIPYEQQFEKKDSMTFCKVFVNHHLLTTSHGFTAKNARENATNEAYEKLKQICYILKVKARIMSDGTIIDKNATSGVKRSSAFELPSAVAEGNSVDKPLAENVGSKLMRSMGWTGGGLGKEEQGIKEPVGMSKQIKRSGLGLPATTNSRGGMSAFEKIARSLLIDYASKNTIFDLVFSSEFSKEERAVMHKQAQILRLKSKSYGNGDNRSLVVSKKKDYCEIVEHMLQTGQTSNDHYELIKPPISLPQVTEAHVSEHEKEVKCENTQKSQMVSSQNAEFSQSSVLKSTEDTLSGCAEISKSEKNVTVDKCSVNGQSKTNHLRENGNSVEAGPFGLLVLVEDENCFTPVQIIERSANGCRIPFKYEYENVGGGMICKLFVNNVLVTSAKEVSKKKAREATLKSGIEKLRNVCYTLKRIVETGNDSLNIIKTLKLPHVTSDGVSDSKLEKNILCISRRVDRTYLGVGKSPNGISPTLFKTKIRIFLKEYLNESCPYDVIIPPDFSSPERLFIRKTASGLALKTYLHEVSKKDFLVLSKKLSLVETAKAILLSGGNTKPDFHEEVRIV